MIEGKKVYYKKLNNPNKTASSSTSPQKKAVIIRSKVTVTGTRAAASEKITVVKVSDTPQPTLAMNSANAAILLGISEPFLRKMRGEGTGPNYVKIGKKIVYRIEDLKAFLAANLVK